MPDVIALTGMLALNALFMLWLLRGDASYSRARLADDAERLARQAAGVRHSRRE